MKKIFIMIAIAIIFSSVCYAEETELSTDYAENDFTEEMNAVTEKEFNIQEYLTERILPVVAGVVTSLVALLGTVGKVKSSLTALNSSSGALKELKESAAATLDGVKRELTAGLHSVEKTVAEIPEIKESYSELKNNYSELIKQNKLLMEALKLGFEVMPEAVQSGNARKIAILTEQASAQED